jgi:flagellar basal-body rod modification protein FlgD
MTMAIKRGTNTFSAAKQTQVSKGDEGSNLSAGDLERAYGSSDLGDVLNKVADPNWVDPTKKMRTSGDAKLDKDAFLKLMLAQMKHQDPTNPMQSHEMAAQLAQFTSLEQMNNMNTTLEAIKNNSSPNSNYQVLGLIGKKISGDSSKLIRAAGDTKQGISFELLGDTQKVNVTVKDAAGTVVRKMEFAGLKKGRNAVEWNGLNDEGMSSRPGEYRISVEGVSSAGQKVHAKTAFSGRITGLSYTNEGPVLLVGEQTVRLSDVKKIEDVGPEVTSPAVPLGAGAMASPIKHAPVKPIDAKKGPSDDNLPPAEEAPPQVVNNLNDVPMAGELIKQIAKVTK